MHGLSRRLLPGRQRTFSSPVIIPLRHYNHRSQLNTHTRASATTTFKGTGGNGSASSSTIALCALSVSNDVAMIGPSFSRTFQLATLASWLAFRQGHGVYADGSEKVKQDGDLIPYEEVTKHNAQDDCWVVINGQVRQAIVSQFTST